jgi:hypothetical protein
VSALQKLFPDNFLARAAARDSIAPVPAGDIAMKALDRRTMVHLDVVLEDACRSLPHGGDHATRKKIAQKLLSSARKGNLTIDSLSAVAQDALDEATKRNDVRRRTDAAQPSAASRFMSGPVRSSPRKSA